MLRDADLAGVMGGSCMPVNSNLRILIVGKKKSGGGTEKHIADVVKALRERGLRVQAAYLEDGAVSVLRDILGADVIHFFLPRPYLIGSVLAMMAGKRCRIMSRRSLRSCYQTPLIRFVENTLHNRTRILIGNSPAVCEELRQEAPKADIRLIRNGTNIKPMAHVPSHTFRMLCVANMFPYKGHDDLLNAIERIRPGLLTSWKLILAGRGTERLRWLRPDPHIIGVSYCENIPRLLANADLFILPSHEEGSSNALLEAMVCGVPVVATDVGGNKDMIVHGRTGMLVPPRSPEKLAVVIQSMIENPQICRQMAQLAQFDVAARFSFEAMINDYEKLYAGV